MPGRARGRLHRQPPPLRLQKGMSSAVPLTALLCSFPSHASSSSCRARELQAEERLQGRYRPPALRAMASTGSPSNDASPSSNTPVDGSPLPPTNFPAGFRRARAGTLPSNVQLAAQQRFAASVLEDSLPNVPGSADSYVDTYSQDQQQHAAHLAAATASALGGATRPSLRHSASIASSAASSALTERNSRLRSGSLTLPAASGFSNAFGSSIFSTSWLSNNRNGGSNFPALDELRSVTSLDSAGGDDFDVHTLDYLGLDDTHRHQPAAATLSELRNQAQAAIAGNLANPPRNRANTVSNPYAVRQVNVRSSLLPTSSTDEGEDDMMDNYGGVYGQQRLDVYEDSGVSGDNYFQSSYVAKGFKPTAHLSGVSQRQRAISVGTLDDPTRVSHRLVSALDAQQDQYGNDLGGQLGASANIGPGSGSTLSKFAGRTGQSGVRFTTNDQAAPRGTSSYLAAPSGQQRAVSPKSEGSSAQLQAPTRSLWIGNLDSSVTSEQLIHVFAPYGAIESLRLLPEKVSDERYLTHGTCIDHPCRNVASLISSTRRMPSGPRRMC